MNFDFHGHWHWCRRRPRRGQRSPACSRLRRRVAVSDIDGANRAAAGGSPGRFRRLRWPDTRHCAANGRSRMRGTHRQRLGAVPDIVVNNAGYAKRTPVQDITTEVRRHRGKINMQRLPQLPGLLPITCAPTAGAASSSLRWPGRTAARSRRHPTRQPRGRGDHAVEVLRTAAREHQRHRQRHRAGPISTAKGGCRRNRSSFYRKLVPIGRFGEASEFAAAVALQRPTRAGSSSGRLWFMNGGLLCAEKSRLSFRLTPDS